MSTRARWQTQNTTFPGAHNSLLLPSNISGSDTSAPFVALQFLNPHLNGLPIWGPSDQGVSAVYEISYNQQTGYYNPICWSNNGTFLWDSGSSNSYWIFCPYPTNSSNTGTSHWYEIAGMDRGADKLTNINGANISVVKGVKKVHGFRITHNNPGGSGTKTARFYPSLPLVSNDDVIQVTSPDATFGNTNPPSPALTLGDSPWYSFFQHERASSYLGRIKIFSKVISEADLLSEAADFTRLVTADGAANIWWGKKDWTSVDALTCDYGTGRAPVWADSANKGTLGAPL